jgi:hypothetical protein
MNRKKLDPASLVGRYVRMVNAESFYMGAVGVAYDGYSGRLRIAIGESYIDAPVECLQVLDPDVEADRAEIAAFLLLHPDALTYVEQMREIAYYGR